MVLFREQYSPDHFFSELRFLTMARSQSGPGTNFSEPFGSRVLQIGHLKTSKVQGCKRFMGPYCDNTTPTPTSNASTSMMNCLLRSGCISASAEEKSCLSFREKKALSASGVNGSESRQRWSNLTVVPNEPLVEAGTDLANWGLQAKRNLVAPDSLPQIHQCIVGLLWKISSIPLFWSGSRLIVVLCCTPDIYDERIPSWRRSVSLSLSHSVNEGMALLNTKSKSSLCRSPFRLSLAALVAIASQSLA